MLGLGSSLAKGGASLLTFVKDNLKLYLDFKSNKSDTLKFPSEGSTSFNGSSDFIACGELDSNTFTNSYDDGLTMSAWFKTDVIEYAGIMELGLNSSSNFGTAHILVHGDNSQVGLRINNAATAVYSGNNTIVAGQWYHVTTVYDGATNKIKIYLDGEFKAEATASNALDFNSNGRKITLGAYKSSFKLDGQLANASIWSRALEPEEIQSIMNKSYSQLKGVEKTSLVSWWALDTETLSDNLATSWANGAGDAEVFNTNGANIVSLVNSSGQVNVTTNSFATRYRVYKVSYDYTLVSGDHPFFFTATNTSQDGNVPVSSTFASLGSSWYFTADTGTNFAIWRDLNFSIIVDNFSIQEVISADSHGNNTGYYSSAKSSAVSSHNSATTTTSVYGGNAPILPRAVDVAKEGQADAIGNGSASFDGGTDRIEISDFTYLNAVPKFTITAWMKRLESNDAVTIEKSPDGNNRLGINLYTDGKVYMNVGNGGIAFGGANLTGTDWNHVAVVFDGSLSGNANRAKIYINGILQTLTFTGTIPTETDSNTNILYFGYDPINNNYSTGNLSQVGFWLGALTQSQVQEVLESTSYSKIPADVKSTLGSEISGDPTFDNASNWTISLGNGGVDVNTTVSGKLSVVNAQDTRLQKYSILTVGKLYKVTFVIDSYSSGRVRGLLDTAITFIPTGAGTYTRYFVASQTYFLLSFDSTANMTMTDISIKEVTNDLVSYYPLDGSSSRANGTDDVTTGEVLGDELADTTTYTGGSNGSEFYIRNSNVPTLGGIYKLTFDVDSYSSGSFYFTTNTGSNPRVEPSVYSTTNSSIGSQNGSETYYLKINVGGGFKFKASGTYNANVSNISLKEITSNTGVLY